MSARSIIIKTGDFFFATLLNVKTYTGKRKMSDLDKAKNIAFVTEELATCEEYCINGHLVRITDAQATIIRLADNLPLLSETLRSLVAAGCNDEADVVFKMYEAVKSPIRPTWA